MRITSCFDELSFHDAAIENVARIGNDLRLEVSGVFVSSNHPESKGENYLVEKGIFTINHVVSERAVTWHDTVMSVEHETPDFPIDEIMHATFNGQTFHFDGFKDTLPWHEWFIDASGFELNTIIIVKVSS